MVKDAKKERFERYFAEHESSPAQREFLEKWLTGPPFDAQNADAIREFVISWAEVSGGLTAEKAISRLQNATLPPDLAYQEAALRRLGNNPSHAYRYISAKIEAVSKKNAEIAKRERPTRWDRWKKLIEDCLDDHPRANTRAIMKYLQDDEFVELRGEELHHIGNSADPISKEQVRNRLYKAKKRRRLGA